MKRNFRLLAIAVVAMVATTFTSCNVDDDFMIEPTVQEDLQTRAVDNPNGTTTITFEDFDDSMLAGPTSLGENYYDYYGYTRVTQINDPDDLFTASANRVVSDWGVTEDFSSGCIALSNWNIYGSNPPGVSNSDWWYSYENQCSVYNTASVSGDNEGAGHNNSDRFAVVYGYVDSYNQGYMQKPSFSFDEEYTLKELWFCNNAYTYGVMKFGNSFGSIGVAQSLESSNGYFKVILECYDGNGVRVATKEQYLAEYRNGYDKVEPVTTWTKWEINVQNVKTVKFNFQGSDTGDWGLNTPAYICIDDITIQ